MPGLVGWGPFVADDLVHHNLGLFLIGGGKPSQVEVTEGVISHDLDEPVVDGALTPVMGPAQVGRHLGGRGEGVSPGVEVPLGVVGGIAHQHHVLGCGGLPVGVCVAQEVLYGLGVGDAVVEAVIDLVGIDRHDPKPLASAVFAEVPEPAGGITSGIPADLPVGDDDVVGPVLGILQSGRGLVGDQSVCLYVIRLHVLYL